MSSKLTTSLRDAPATIPALAAIALLIAWATDQAGYPVTHWGPGALIVLGLLGVALGAVGLRWTEVSRPVRIALCCLAAYTALSFLSILWAEVPGDAWEGANRTLLYLLVFALFACWRQRGVSAALLMGVWTLAMIGLAAFVALHLSSVTSATLQSLLPGGRLIYPSGYANANAALWLMAFWPALLLARSPRLPWGLRGGLAGGAVLLAEVALLSQSRGSLYATPVMLGLVFLLLPERTRTFAVLVPVAAGIGAAAPTVLDVGNHLHNGNVSSATLHSATTAMFAAALIVGLLTAAGAAVERTGSRSGAVRPGAFGVSSARSRSPCSWRSWRAAGSPPAIRSRASTTPGTRSRAAADMRPTARAAASRAGWGATATTSTASRSTNSSLTRWSASARTTSNSSTSCTAAATRPRATRTASSCARWSQTGLAGALLALIGLGGALLAAARAIRPRREEERTDRRGRSARQRRGCGGAERVRLLGRAWLI